MEVAAVISLMSPTLIKHQPTQYPHFRTFQFLKKLKQWAGSNLLTLTSQGLV